MKNVFVIGAGTMGLDIAQVFATAGYNVTAYGRTDASIGKSSAKLTKSLAKRVDRGKMTQEAADAILAHITFVTDYENLKTADLVIEAIVENMEIKHNLYAAIDETLPRAHHFCNQHKLPFHHGACRLHQARGQVHRNALLQPRNGHEAC